MQPNHLLAASAAALFALHCHAMPDAGRRPETDGKAQDAVPGLRILSSAHHRAIFCGRDGTETGAAYARALASDLKRLESTGRSTVEALAYLERRACPGK